MPPSVDALETPIVDDILDGVPDAEPSDPPTNGESNGNGEVESNGESMVLAIRKAPKSEEALELCPGFHLSSEGINGTP
jgi:hypothetical protein